MVFHDNTESPNDELHRRDLSSNRGLGGTLTPAIGKLANLRIL